MLYCRDGVLTYCQTLGAGDVFHLRGDDRLPPGEREVRYEFAYDGGGLGKGGLGTLLVDDNKVAESRVERTPAGPFFEGFDVGVSLRTVVGDELRSGDNAFNGTIQSVHIAVTEATAESANAIVDFVRDTD